MTEDSSEDSDEWRMARGLPLTPHLHEGYRTRPEGARDRYVEHI